MFLKARKRARPALVAAAGLLLLAACAHKELRPPTLERAQGLKGSRYEDVEKSLGHPAMKDSASRAWWFLSEETENHPAPEAVLYEFRFRDERLAEIKRDATAARP